MSLRIGYVKPTITNKERVVLSSQEQTNLIVMDNANLKSTGIAFNSNQTHVLRTLNDAFNFESQGQTIASFAKDTAYISGKLAIGDDLVVGGSFQSGTLGACNIEMTVKRPFIFGESTQYISVKEETGSDLLYASFNYDGNTNMYFAGKLGIGTNEPQEALHVSQGAIIDGPLKVGGELTTSYLGYPPSYNSISLASSNLITIDSDSTVIRGNAIVQGTLRVDGQFFVDIPSTDKIIAIDSVSTGALFVTNLTQTRDSVNVTHNTFSTRCNVLNIDIKTEAASLTNFNALTMDFRGRLGLGTALPAAIMHVVEDHFHAASNILSLQGLSSNTRLVYDRNGMLGIGTDTPLYRLHIHASNEPYANWATTPLIGVVNASTNVRKPFFTAFSNQTPVLSVSHKGGLTVGNTQGSDAWDVSIASNVRVPHVETSSIMGSLPSRTIQMNQSTFSNIAWIHTSNIQATNIHSRSNITDFMYAFDYHIPAFSVINTKGYFEVKLDRSFIVSDRLYVGDRESVGTLPITASGDWPDDLDGRVVVKPIATDSASTPIGIHVYGGNTIPTTGMKVTAATAAQMILTAGNKSALVQHDNTGLRLDADNLTAPFVMNTTGIQFMNNLVRIAPEGRLIIGSVPVDESLTGSLFVRADIRFDDTNKRQRLRFDHIKGWFGIGTPSPEAPLHVADRATFTSNVTIKDTTLHIDGNDGCIGIRTAPDKKYSLNLVGDINFDGTLYRNGIFYPASQWTTNNTNIYIRGSNVGIGTDDPKNYGLYVHTPAYFNSNVTFQGLVTTLGSITSISDRSIKTNLQPLTRPLDRIDRLTGYMYDRIDTGIRECGLIAQEVNEVVPELVRPSGSDPKMLSIAYGNMAALFVEAIKALNQRLSNAEKEIRELRHQQNS